MATTYLFRFLVLLTLFISQAAHAQYFTGPAAAGTGGAGRAMVEGSESAFLNPATVAYFREYFVSGVYAAGMHEQAGFNQTYGLILSDGSPERVLPGALTYLRRRTSGGGINANEEYVAASLAEAISKYVSVGVTGHYRALKVDTGARYFQTNVDLGLIFSPLENFGIGFVAYNILSAQEKVPVGVRDIPSFGIGSNLILSEVFRLRLDFVRPEKFNPRHRIDTFAGIETEFNNGIISRVGGRWEETQDSTWLTLGTGYRGPRLSFNYAYEQDLRVSDSYRHLIDLWMPF